MGFRWDLRFRATGCPTCSKAGRSRNTKGILGGIVCAALGLAAGLAISLALAYLLL